MVRVELRLGQYQYYHTKRTFELHENILSWLDTTKIVYTHESKVDEFDVNEFSISSWLEFSRKEDAILFRLRWYNVNQS